MSQKFGFNIVPAPPNPLRNIEAPKLDIQGSRFGLKFSSGCGNKCLPFRVLELCFVFPRSLSFDSSHIPRMNADLKLHTDSSLYYFRLFLSARDV